MKPTSVALPSELTERIDQVARDSERSRSYVVRKLLENALTGEDRLRALEAIADAGLEANAAERTNRKRAPNATEIIAENSTAGHDAVRAHQAIAAGGRKPR
jgi:predicted transcriptional regulator